MAPGFAGAGPSTSLLMNNSAIMGQSSILSRITSDPQILTYAVRVFGTTDLTEDQWKQCMDQIKVITFFYNFGFWMLRKEFLFF